LNDLAILFTEKDMIEHIDVETIINDFASIGRDIAYYMLGPGFESRTLHFSTIKLYEL